MSAGLDPQSKRFYVVVLGLAPLAVTGAALASPIMAWTWATLVWGMGLGAICLLFQVRAFTTVWRGQRLALHPDEAVLLVACVLLPGHAVLTMAVASSVLGQAWLRKSLLKAAFNVAAQAVAAGAGVAAFAIAHDAGVSSVGAAFVVPPVVSLVNQAIVAMFLTRLGGRPLSSAWNASLVGTVSVASLAGITVGVVALALHDFHPFALILAMPVGYLVHRSVGWAVHAENELTTRRALNEFSSRLLANEDAGALPRLALEASREALAPIAAGIRIGELAIGDDRAARPAHAVLLESSLRARDGTVAGSLWVVLPARSESEMTAARALLDLLAGHVALAAARASADEAVVRSEKRFRVIHDAAPHPIYVLDSAGRVIHANPAAGTVEPRAALDSIFTADSLRALRSSPDASQGIELVAQHGTRYLEARMLPLTLDDGAPGHLLATSDITQRVLHEREAEMQRQALARAERLAALGTLVAGVAHEVNNPLMYMMGNVDLVLMDVDDIETELAPGGALLESVDLTGTRERLATIRSGAERIQKITKALGVVARAQRTPVKQIVETAEIFAEVETLARTSVPEEVALSFSGEDGLAVAGVQSELCHAILALVQNGIDATAAGGSVRILSRRVDEEVAIIVEDDGVGMAEDAQKQAFTPFFTTKPEGTGLGLAGVLSIVTAHGGTVRLESRQGHGTRVEVRLPPGSPLSAPPAADAIAPSSGELRH